VDFDLPPEAETYRAEVRSFLDETLAGGSPPSDWFTRMAEAGYTAPHWPPPWGLSAPPVQQLVIDEELRRAGVGRPMNPIGLGWAGPTLLVAGSEEQQRRFLPGILDGSELWCQLFSEPGAGSDLASLSTRAVRDGDEWVVDGQKIWTSIANFARWAILLARTDPTAGKHAGISYFVLDMRTPGIDVRPIRQMTGGAEFNEVFLDAVRIPAENLVGTEGDGWRLARVTLGNERVALSEEGALWGRGPSANDLVDVVRSVGGVSDPVLRQRVASIWSESEILRLLRLRTLSAQMHNHEPGPEASVRKALSDLHGQRLYGLAMQLSGSWGMLNTDSPTLPPTKGWSWSAGFLFSPALTIGGGTSEVQRNIIAERVLGLPRDP
jgi:alkylation response protein AidB-like acyl-CoA dehydrogenase